VVVSILNDAPIREGCETNVIEGVTDNVQLNCQSLVLIYSKVGWLMINFVFVIFLENIIKVGFS
jgi:hypothetical protein